MQTHRDVLKLAVLNLQHKLFVMFFMKHHVTLFHAQSMWIVEGFRGISPEPNSTSSKIVFQSGILRLSKGFFIVNSKNDLKGTVRYWRSPRI